MLRILLSIALVWAFSFGADEDKTYIFKAKGKFAQELKELMKKHEKDGDIEIEEVKPDFYNKSSHQKSSPNMIDSFLNTEDLSGDIGYGKNIYDSKCSRCHGEFADKSSYPSARILKTLSKEELYYALRSYKTDATYGGVSKFIMNQQALGMTTPEMISVSAYIYSLSHPTSEAIEPLNKKEEEIEKKEGVQGTYLR